MIGSESHFIVVAASRPCLYFAIQLLQSFVFYGKSIERFLEYVVVKKVLYWIVDWLLLCDIAT
jgi:hypothetical protein